MENGTSLAWILLQSYERDRGRERSAFSLLLMLLLFSPLFLWLAYGGPIFFQKEGYNRPSIPFSKLQTVTVEGRPAYLLPIRRLTPNEQVRVYVSSSVAVVRVQIVDSFGNILFQEERNGSVSALIHPWRVSDVSLRIIPLCSPCAYTGWENVWYTEYSISPHFEVLGFAAGSLTSAILLASANYLALRFRPSTKRWRLWFITMPVALAFSAWYTYAFDIRELPWYAFAFSSLGATLAVLFFILTGHGEQLDRRREAGNIEIRPIVEREVLARSYDPLATAQSWVQEEVRGKVEKWSDLEIVEQGKDYIEVRGKAQGRHVGSYIFVIVIERRTGEVCEKGRSYVYPIPHGA